MTPQEFKAWFDGFTEAFTGLPSKTQWMRIKARVAEIDGSPVTERVYVDRYWPTYVHPYRPYLAGGSWQYLSGTTAGSAGSAVTSTSTVNLAASVAQNSCFNSIDAMADLGRAEAQSLAA